MVLRVCERDTCFDATIDGSESLIQLRDAGRPAAPPPTMTSGVHLLRRGRQHILWTPSTLWWTTLGERDVHYPSTSRRLLDPTRSHLSRMCFVITSCSRHAGPMSSAIVGHRAPPLIKILIAHFRRMELTNLKPRKVSLMKLRSLVSIMLLMKIEIQRLRTPSLLKICIFTLFHWGIEPRACVII